VEPVDDRFLPVCWVDESTGAELFEELVVAEGGASQGGDEGGGEGHGVHFCGCDMLWRCGRSR